MSNRALMSCRLRYEWHHVVVNEGQTGTVWCFQCGTEYDEDVEECLECGVPTTAEAPRSADQVGGEDDDQLAYELHEWTGQGRSILDGMLTRAGVEHAWQGATLIVREDDEEAVDQAISETEVVEMPTLDLTQPTVVYELGELDVEQHGRLLRRLGVDGVSHAFDRAGDLFVYERDEEKVDALFDGLDEADASEREFGPGIPGVDPVVVMSDLFVGASRLRKKPADAKGTVAVVEGAALVDQMSLPYGMTGEQWGEVVDTTAALAGVLTGDEALPEELSVAEMAGELAELLRRMV